MSPWIRPAQSLLDDGDAEVRKVKGDMHACNLIPYGRGTAVQRILHLEISTGFFAITILLDSV